MEDTVRPGSAGAPGQGGCEGREKALPEPYRQEGIAANHAKRYDQWNVLAAIEPLKANGGNVTP